LDLNVKAESFQKILSPNLFYKIENIYLYFPLSVAILNADDDKNYFHQNIEDIDQNYN